LRTPWLIDARVDYLHASLARVENDRITAVSVEPHAYVPRSLELQRAFAAAVPAVVVGRRLDDVHVGKLAGSSGRPDGFNDAIRQIRNQARRGAPTAP
jgi:hypothetical protein